MIARPTLGGALLCFLLGSVHAYSTLIEPIEASTGASRASVSLVYSTATVSMVLGVLAAPWLLRRARIERLALASGLVAASGLLIASWAAYLSLLAGFGVVFGLANGLGYAISVRAASTATPARAAFDLGIISAAYCGGAMVFSRVLAWFATPDRWPVGLYVLAALLVAGAFVTLLLLRAPLADGSEAPTSALSRRDIGRVIFLWVLYFFAMFTCLMIFGHAATIVSAVGGTADLAAAGAVLVGAGSLVGSVVAGYFGDRTPPARILMVSFFAAAGAMLVLWQVATPLLVLSGLSVIGVAYGALIGIMPAHVRTVFAPAVAFSAFSWIFLAWGAAGFLGPWAAGIVFDETGAYRLAFVIGLMALVAAAALTLSFRQRGGYDHGSEKRSA